MATEAIPEFVFNRNTAPAILYRGILSFLFINATDIDQIIKRLAHSIDPTDTCFAVNLYGATVFATDLKRALTQIHGSLPESCRFIDVRYTSTDSNATSGHVQRVIPLTKELIQAPNLHLIEDMTDTGNVLQKIVKDARAIGVKSTASTVLFARKGVEVVLPSDHRHNIGATISSEWIGGRGPDFGTPEVPGNHPRDSRDVLVLIPPEQQAQVWKEIYGGNRVLISSRS